LMTNYQALELREEEAKKAKLDQARRRREEAAEEEIMDAGKRMLEEAQRRAAATAKTAGQAAPDILKPVHASTSASTSTSQPPITPMDLTLILQFPSTSNLSDDLQDRLTSSYGPLNHVFIKDPPEVEGKKKKKGKKAIVEFKEGNWGGCWACWRDLEGGKEGWEGVKVKWAGGATPDWVAWSETHRPPRGQVPAPDSESGRDTNTRTNEDITPNTRTDALPTFSSAPNFGSTTMSDLLASHSQSRTDQINRKKREDEFESMTLLKMRQMERERLIEEIRREEEA
jgi:DnaJ family protein C protein 17